MKMAEVQGQRNPFLKRASQAPANGHGRLSERRVATKVGARLTPNSGALVGAKSDAVCGSYRMEMKSTNKTTLAIELAWLAKITREARQQGQTPALLFSFVNAEGKPAMDMNADWVAIPLWKFNELKGLEND
jgi:hypothetical protein